VDEEVRRGKTAGRRNQMTLVRGTASLDTREVVGKAFTY